jgi:hypothetical protein
MSPVMYLIIRKIIPLILYVFSPKEPNHVLRNLQFTNSVIVKSRTDGILLVTIYLLCHAATALHGTFSVQKALEQLSTGYPSQPVLQVQTQNVKINLNSEHPLNFITQSTILQFFNSSRRNKDFIHKQQKQEELQVFSLITVIFGLLLNVNGHFKIMQQKLNVFEFNVKLFIISGVIPSENINSSLWKSALFRIFQALLLLLVTSMNTLQSLAIFEYWGNINLMADSFGLLGAFVGMCFTGFYITIFWKNFSDVTDTFEISSIFCSELVRSNPKHMKILNETLNLGRIYNKVISITMGIMPIFFIFPTFVQHLITSDEDIIQAAETVDGFTKYFLFVIWLPPVVKQKLIIRVMYGLQCICLWEICLFTAAIAPLYVVLFLFTGTQFKLISSLIREMDEVMFRVETPGNILHEVPDTPFTADINKTTYLFRSPISNYLPLKSQLESEESSGLFAERMVSSKVQENSLQQGEIYQHLEIVHDPSSPEITSTTKNDPGSVYLLECIKLHQASIK